MNITLRKPTIEDTDELYEVVARNREHLKNLVWTDSATRLSTEKFLASVPKTEKLRLILRDGNIVGMITLRKEGYRLWSIGYWLAHADRRQGIMTQAVQQMLMNVPKGEFVEAHIRKNNIGSQKVLAANAFTHDSVSISTDGKEWLDVWAYKSKHGFFKRFLSKFWL